MRKIIFLLLLFAVCGSLSGCSESRQVENLAYTLILGIDLNDKQEVVLSVVIPKISGSSSGESSSGGESDYVVYSASGSQFTEALYMLKWAVPRNLDLSQTELIIVSESMASSPIFRETAESIIGTNGLYSRAKPVVCEGKAANLIEAISPVIGPDLSSELTALFEDYTRLGFIPDATFADFYYRTESFLSDPIVTHATVSSPDSVSKPESPADGTEPLSPDPSKIIDAGSEQTARFLGAAVFHDGKIAGFLTAEELLYCNLIRGEKLSFPYLVNDVPVYLTTIGKPSVTVDTDSQPVEIGVSFRFAIWTGGKAVDLSILTDDLEENLIDVIRVCREFGAEPFLLADKAVRNFRNSVEWESFNWPQKFRDSNIQFSFSFFHEEE